jgi:DNA helicase II / ATP-dependent DNA helicase PcrA
MADALLAGLNAAQRAAVISTAPVLQVLAPPGSGKTKTLTTRVAHLLAHRGYAPQNVICCTFTIKASREMRERLQTLVGENLESKLVLGTFHSVCRRYLVAYGNLIGIPKGFGIADTSDSTSILKKVVKKHGLSTDHKTLRSRISSHKAKGKTLTDLPKTPGQLDKQEFITAFQEYQAALALSNLLDYDDLLLLCVELLRAYPNCVANVEALLIDEFQDTNIVQLELMKLFASAKRRVTIVGDPDQSIYGFRSAETENLGRMKAYYPETVVINLEENYRSCSSILNLAQDVIEQDTKRSNKKLKSTHCYGTLPVLRKVPNPHEEALWIAAEIKRTISLTGGLLKHSDIAVLIRSAYLSLLIEKAFTGSGVPYRMVGGMRFFDRLEIRLAIDYLRTISHPDNNSAFLSIINVPSRKIGETTIASLAKLAEEKSLSLWSVVQKVLAGTLALGKKMSGPSQHDLQKLVNLIKTARQKMKTMTPAEVPSKLIVYVVSTLRLQAYLQKKYKDDFEDRIENIQELVLHAKDIVAQSADVPLPTMDGLKQQQGDGGQEALDHFLANIVLSTEVETSDKQDKPSVTISTIHSAKGLEWPVVFVPAVYEGSIPHSRAEDTDEERRLLYVAMTRTQAMLTLSFPMMQSRDQGESVLTHFLPTNVHHRFADRGPLFNDGVISNIAKTLRREMPSQADIAKGVTELAEEDSIEDDNWPADGSHRMRPEAISQGPFMGQGRSLDDALVGGSSFPGFHGFQKASMSTMAVATTMSNQTSLSTANLTLGFTTAGQQLKKAPGTLADPAPPMNSFFAATAHRRQQPQQPLQVQQQSSIPSIYSSHKLGTAVALAGQKRRPTLEETSPNPKRQYVFLSSSPRSEDGTKESPVQSDDPAFPQKTDARPASSNLKAKAAASTSQIPQSTTFHTTSLSALKAQGRYGVKTLGVRRTMNGWNERKNK